MCVCVCVCVCAAPQHMCRTGIVPISSRLHSFVSIYDAPFSSTAHSHMSSYEAALFITKEFLVGIKQQPKKPVNDFVSNDTQSPI